MIDVIRLTYAALAQAPTAGHGLRVHALDATDGKIQLGLDEEGREHLLVESPRAPARQSGIVAITTVHRQLTIGDPPRRYLDVTCEAAELVEVFDHFVAAVAERASGSDSDLGALVDTVLDRWRSFFEATGAPPAPETITGAVGELLLLREIAVKDPADVLATWVGPRGGRHDFRRGAAAIEVKTSRSHTSRVVSIHGVDQLLEPDGGTLHLQFVRLEEVAGQGVCISDLIDDLADLGVPRLGLLEVLVDAGIPPAALNSVGATRFQIRERLTLPVDDAMPRIVPATFADGKQPAGIVDIRYRVDLDHVEPRALTEPAYEALVALMTSGGSTA